MLSSLCFILWRGWGCTFASIHIIKNRLSPHFNEIPKINHDLINTKSCKLNAAQAWPHWISEFNCDQPSACECFQPWRSEDPSQLYLIGPRRRFATAILKLLTEIMIVSVWAQWTCTNHPGGHQNWPLLFKITSQSSIHFIEIVPNEWLLLFCCSVSSDSGCLDQYYNCLVVVQARLCIYPYYTSICCASCSRGRNPHPSSAQKHRVSRWCWNNLIRFGENKPNQSQLLLRDVPF